MADQQQERRGTNGKQRRNRLAVGGGSAPFAIIICYWINTQFEIPDNDMLNIAINTAVGSIVTAASVCFYDLRGILLAAIRQRRNYDRKRRAARKKAEE